MRRPTPDRNPPARPRSRRAPRVSRKNKIVIGLIILITGILIRAEWQRRSALARLEQARQQVTQDTGSSAVAKDEQIAREILTRVRRLIDVPQNPEPAVASIADVERLRQQSDFYDKAKNGDYLVITDKRAILYSPERDIVLDVAPVQLTAPSPSPPGAVAGSAAGPAPLPPEPSAEINNNTAPLSPAGQGETQAQTTLPTPSVSTTPVPEESPIPPPAAPVP